MDPSEDPTKMSSLKTQAINLKAAEGDVAKVELLSTPDAEVDGLPDRPRILDAWEK